MCEREQATAPVVGIEPIDLPGALAPEYIRAHKLIPISRDRDSVTIAAAYEAQEDIVDDMRVAFRVPEVRWIQVPEVEVEAAIERAMAASAETADEVLRDLSEISGPLPDGATAEDLTSLANQPPVVRLVNIILRDALGARASDVHLECHDSGLGVRYRIDGALLPALSPPPGLRDAIISRVKVMAGLDIAERRAPQDGRVRLQLKDQQIDVRVSTLPGIHGESVVMRLLDGRGEGLSLDELGMQADTLAAFDRLIRRPHGIVLVSGPTGSGKTTTLYGALSRIKTGQEKIVTVEDPVEYRVDGITQVQVNPAAGVTFASALRSILRQDPDIILIGEMRDAETAEIAVHAALTGHLVLSTVHTNDAPTGITRLLDLGVPGFLAASTVRGILAQRLVRRICQDCRAEIPASVPLLEGSRDNEGRTWQGRGCDSCRGTGYRGRIGIFELLVPDEAIRGEILSHRGSESVRELAVSKGMRTLREDGLGKVAAGVTSREEVGRAAQEE